MSRSICISDMNGRKSNLADRQRSTSGASRTANLRYTRCVVSKSGHYESFVASFRTRLSCSPLRGVDHSRRMRLTGTSNGLRSAPASISRYMLTCCGTLAALRWRMRDTIRGPSKIGLAIGQSSILCGTPNCHPHGSETSGADCKSEVVTATNGPIGPDFLYLK